MLCKVLKGVVKNDLLLQGKTESNLAEPYIGAVSKNFSKKFELF
jgi:hypothetical protein